MGLCSGFCARRFPVELDGRTALERSDGLVRFHGVGVIGSSSRVSVVGVGVVVVGVGERGACPTDKE